MVDVPHRSLRILAAITWYSGGIVLLAKACSLLAQAWTTDPESAWLWLAPITGFLIGSFKVVFLFNRFCERNLERIDALRQPKIWEFFRPRFFLFLGAMILLGAMLSRLAIGNYPLLVGVIILDFSLAMALLGSSQVFWKRRAFAD